MKLLRRDFLHLAAGVAALLAVSQPAHAQGYPSRPITVIVPFPAGGGTDVIARTVSEHMSRTLGQPIVIENIAGAGGTTGTARAARADPNGYTIEMGHMGTHASAVAFYPNLAYKPDVDFAPIGLSSLAPVMIVARRDFPAKDLQEFVSYVKANAQKLIAPSPAKVDSPAFSRAADDAHVIGIKGSKQLLNTSAGLVRLLATKIDRARSSGSLEPGSARRNQRTPCIELANAGIFHVTVRAGLIGAYHAASARIMQIYGGFLAEFRGDGILAYFGYP